MTTFLDASCVVAHVTANPPADADAVAALFSSSEPLLLSDVAIADAIGLLERGFEVPRHLVATTMRALVGHPTVVTVDTPVLLRAIGIYEIDGLRFPSAYAVALAESTGVERVASLDRAVDRVRTVERVGTS